MTETGGRGADAGVLDEAEVAARARTSGDARLFFPSRLLQARRCSAVEDINEKMSRLIAGLHSMII